jgi:cytochrome c-type biogenesis protein CcmE
MTPRRQRMLLIGLVLGGVVVSATFAFRAFRENLTYFFSPTQVAAGEAPHRQFRLGGMVLKDSVTREPGSLTVRFTVSDFANTVPVQYTGVLPDLFKEGTGVVVRGKLDVGGEFLAEEVLAKHDEKYMPPEVADALEKGRATVSE